MKPLFLLLALVCALVLAAPATSGVRVVTRSEPIPAAAARSVATEERVLPARAAPTRFNLVGIHWRGPGTIAFRTARAGGRWSVWRSARPEEEDRPDARSPEAARAKGWKLGNPYWTGAARRIQYRLTGRVAHLRTHFLWSPVTHAPRRALAAIPRQPAVIRRAQWGANESIVRGSPSYASRLAFAVVHHTAGAAPSSPAQSAAVVRGILEYHVRSNGWSDIGYNFLVDSFGQVFEGRAGGITRNVVGAHAQGFNTGSVGVAVLGTYEGSNISSAARAALVRLLSWRLDLAHVDPRSRLAWTSGGSPKFPAGTTATLNAVNGHRDTGATSCPGAALYGTLAAIASEAAAADGPKLFAPRATGSVGGPVRFTARLSEARDWSVTVHDALGAVVASGSGFGTAVDWTWQSAGSPPGRYGYRIEAGTDVRPVTATLGSAVPLAITGFSVAPAVFTPNGDGVADSVRASVTLSTAATVTAWVEDGAKRRVATLANAKPVRAGTTRFTWKGRAGGRDVPDGRYTLVVEAAAGAERVSRSGSVLLDRTLGAVTARPAAFSPNGDGRRDSLAVGFTLAREAAVRLRVLRGTAVVTTIHTGPLGAGGHRILWAGTADGRRVADGRLRAVVEATTSLGRRVLEREFTLDTRPPRITLLTARRSGRGTAVSFRLSERARVVVQIGGVTVSARRGAGTVSIWRRARPTAVFVRAIDAAKNESAPATAPVRGG